MPCPTSQYRIGESSLLLCANSAPMLLVLFFANPFAQEESGAPLGLACFTNHFLEFLPVDVVPYLAGCCDTYWTMEVYFQFMEMHSLVR